MRPPGKGRDSAGWTTLSRARTASGYCAGISDGHPLVSNKSLWRQFPLLSNRRWFSGKFVLIGDALRTVHFSIGSGTRVGFEDADRARPGVRRGGRGCARALAAFERERRPIVDKLFAAANASSYWYERFPEKMREPPGGSRTTT